MGCDRGGCHCSGVWTSPRMVSGAGLEWRYGKLGRIQAVCVCVCVCARVCVRVRVCVCACVCAGKLEMIEELFHPREGPRSSTHTTSCGVWLPLLKSVGQFLRGCLSQGAVVLAVLALGLVSWPGLGLGPL